MTDYPFPEAWSEEDAAAETLPRYCADDYDYDDLGQAPNGEIIAASEAYETKASAQKGIEAIKTHAPGAKVEDHTG